MIVFLDFEASSLGKGGFPVEVGWAADDGSEEGHLIRPAPSWEEWNAESEGIHRITVDRLRREGMPHDDVARRMAEVLAGHDLYASAPSWDGQWLNKLLRAAGLTRHALHLRDTDEVHRLAVLSALEKAGVPVGVHRDMLDQVLEDARRSAQQDPPAHRALNDARWELRLWRDIGRRANDLAERWVAVRSRSHAPQDLANR